MKKMLFILMALLVATPVMAVNFTLTPGAAGTGKLTVAYDIGATEVVRGMALKFTVLSGNAKILNNTKVTLNPLVTPTFNVFMDYAYDVNQTYTIGTGNAIAKTTGPGAGITYPATSFSVSMGYLDEDGDGTKGEGLTVDSFFDVFFDLTTDSVVKVEADVLRGGAVVGDDIVADNLPLQATLVASVPAPAAPTGVAATDGLFVNKVQVSWTASSGATGYDVYRNTTNAAGGTKIGSNVAGSPYNDNPPPANWVKYYYSIVAKKTGASDSGYSSVNDGYSVSADTGGSPCLVATQVINGLTITSAMVTKWNYLGKPKCWCCNAQKKGNGVYIPSGTANRPDTVDMAAVVNGWFKNYNDATPGYAPCSDFNLSGRIDTVDMAAVVNNYFTTQTNTGCM